jgi:hypothetical protein
LKACPRVVYLLYIHPVHEQLLRESGFLKRLRHSAEFDFVVYGSEHPV